jgi:hypothetical protein
MNNATSETTTLIEIRDFLKRSGHAPAPWATPEAAVEQLYETLSRRRDDELFWADLKDLAARLEDRRFTPPRIPGSQALGVAVTDGLLRELQVSLPPTNGTRRPLGDWIRSRLSAAALTGFLMLGAATACDDGGDGESCSDDPADHGIEGEGATVYNALVDVINESELAHSDKCLLYECLPELDAPFREMMLEEFQTMSDEDLALSLDGLVDGCEELMDEDEDTDDDAH